MKIVKKNSGLTLVELIIVVTIIAILVLVGIAYFRNQIFKGRDARRKADLNRIKVAVEEYEKDHNCYPLPHLVACNPGVSLRPYIDKIPCDPITKSSYFYEYEDDACPSWYRIYTKLENAVGDSAAVPYIGPNAAFNFVQSSPNAPTVVSSTPAPTSSAGGGGEETPQYNFYGCKAGLCVPVSWDPSRPGPECDPNYQSSACYGQCGPEAHECLPWN